MVRWWIGSSHKTYFSHARSQAWVAAVAELARHHPAVGEHLVQLFALPQHPAIADAVRTGAPAGVWVGAQDVSAGEPGARTGEVSAAVLAELGCRLVAVGHAERRRHHGETDEVVAAKVALALGHALVPLICVGEHVEGPAAVALDVVRRQVDAALADVRGAGDHVPIAADGPATIALAYEPVWAIGASQPAPPAHVRAVAAGLRSHLGEVWPGPGRVVYGGSAGPGLLSELGDDVDGLFLGRFAHDPAAIGAVLDEAVELAGSAAR